MLAMLEGGGKFWGSFYAVHFLGIVAPTIGIFNVRMKGYII